MSEEKQHKTLIIKVGYSETLDADISNKTSYGDVLRTTVILHALKDHHITWLVDEKAFPILKHNPMIDRILNYNLTSVLQLQRERYDTVINLEKVPGLSALADQVTAWRRYGFRLDAETGEAKAYDHSHNILDICQDIEKKKSRRDCWQVGLYEMLGKEWRDEPYVLGYKPRSTEQFDIGFNHKVGNKWVLKSWPQEHWKKLEELLGDDYSISWQQGLDNMEDYFEWINSCRLIVTNDSFGLHLAIAMRKKTIALFGPTSSHEVHLYGLGTAFSANMETCEAYPCKRSDCLHYSDTCMSAISPEKVYEEIKRLFPK